MQDSIKATEPSTPAYPPVPDMQGHPSARMAYACQQPIGTAPLQPPSDHPRVGLQTFRRAMQPLSLSASLAEALKGLSQELGVSNFVILLAALKKLLYRDGRQRTEVAGNAKFNQRSPGLS